MHNYNDERNGDRARGARGRDDGYRSQGRYGYDEDRGTYSRGNEDMEQGGVDEARRSYGHDYDRDYSGSGSNYGRGYGDYASGMNAGRMFVELKEQDQRAPLPQVLAELRGRLAQVPGITSYVVPVQNQVGKARPWPKWLLPA